MRTRVGLWAKSPPQTMGQARRVENEDPLSTWEHSIFKKAAPLPSFAREKLIESISDWDMVSLVHDDGEEGLGLFRPKSSFFCLKVKENVYFKYLKGAIHWRLWPFSSKGVLWLLVTIYERSSNHLKEKLKRMVICPTRTRGSSSQIGHEVKSIEVRHWSVVVCGMALYGVLL